MSLHVRISTKTTENLHIFFTFIHAYFRSQESALGKFHKGNAVKTEIETVQNQTIFSKFAKSYKIQASIQNKSI